MKYLSTCFPLFSVSWKISLLGNDAEF
uniref:Uncharacterized protein n=1 Tax=Anguilla anguilla TaxID=7936 RepID=A0A0E9W7U5_ANGAN